MSNVPVQSTFFAWQTSRGKGNKLQRRGYQLPTRCYLSGCPEEMLHHILLHYCYLSLENDSQPSCSLSIPDDHERGHLQSEGVLCGEEEKEVVVIYFVVWLSILLCILCTVWKDRILWLLEKRFLMYKDLNVLLFICCRI